MNAPRMNAANGFTWPVRVYWEDTDAGGIVYYANYLKFMERARTEWLRCVGIEQAVLQQEHGLMFVVVDAQTRFQRPARYGEMLHVSCEIEESRRASLTFRQNIVRGAELLVAGTVRVACLESQSFRPHALPDAVLERIK